MANNKKENKSASEERVMIVVPKPRNVIGDTECTVGINGVYYQIKYDAPVSVPKNVADVIKSHLALQADIENDIENATMKPGKDAMAQL